MSLSIHQWTNNNNNMMNKNKNTTTTTTEDIEIGNGSMSAFRRHKEAAVIEVPALGFHIRGKYQLKAALQTVLFLSLVAGYCVMNYIFSENTITEQTMNNKNNDHHDHHLQNDFYHRILQESTNDDDDDSSTNSCTV